MENKTLDLKLNIKLLDETGTIEGYGSVFGNADSYNDIVQKGAFKKSLKNRPAEKIKMLWQHNTEQVIGIWEEMKEDGNGLYCKGKLILDVEKGREAYALLKAGAIDGLSIGYRTMDSMEQVEDGEETKLLSELDLWEISVVTFPANDKSLVTSVKNIDADPDNKTSEVDTEDANAEIVEDEGGKSDDEKQSQSDMISKCSMKEIDAILKKGFPFTNSGLKSLYSRLAELKSKPEEEIEDIKPEANLDDEALGKNVDALDENEKIAVDSSESETIVDGQTPEDETITKEDKVALEESFIRLNDLMDEIKSFLIK